MTLVIAQKKNGNISFASDSRFNYSKTLKFDLGIKVSPIRVQIYYPNNGIGAKTLAYDHVVGVAVTGSTTAAYTVKEYISEVLKNLMFTPGYTDFSFETITKLVLKFYNRICNQMAELFQKDGICQLILGGYCPKKDCIRTFLLSFSLNQFPIQSYQKEILVDDGILFFGSGEKAAIDVYRANLNFSPLNILRKVIWDDSVDSVGGGLQHGVFGSTDFFIQGIVEDSPTESDPNHCDFLLWGISHYEGEFTEDEDGFLFSAPFIMEHDAIKKP